MMRINETRCHYRLLRPVSVSNSLRTRSSLRSKLSPPMPPAPGRTCTSYPYRLHCQPRGRVSGRRLDNGSKWSQLPRRTTSPELS